MVTEADIGRLYRVWWSPNPHRLECIKPHHCQLHGEPIGVLAGFRKRRNSETNPWGNAIYMAAADDARLQPWEAKESAHD